jgi:hypothetical protein
MSLKKLRPLTFRSKGLSDSIDGTNSFVGAMQSLVNLVQAPGAEGVFLARCASVLQTNFGAFNTPAYISAITVQGTRVYGMIGTARNAGKDEPFCFDVAIGTFIAINGVTAANTPATPAAVGDWTPPVIDAVTNSRIIVTHPGFGGAGYFFGWFDVSGFALNSLKGNTTAGSAVITSINDGGTSAPIIDGVQPGQAISGAGIPAGTTVVSASNGTFSLATTGTTHGTTALDTLASTTGVAVGMNVTGPQFVAGTTVAAIVSGTAVTLSTAALGSVAGTAVTFSGGGSITMSANATATATGVALAIAGGTLAAPLWGAGNTQGNPLSAVPAAVAGFNGRAYFAVGNAIVWSDSLNPCTVTNASQAAILGDSQAVTALVGLPLTSQVTGGIVQALIAFKGAQPFYQITGDSALANLAVSQVNGSVGTLAPNTICGTPLGIAFIAPDGMRILGLSGTTSEPIGAFGKGVALPFINAIYPSRMNAAYNQNTIRISVQNGQAAGQPWQEYWFNFESKVWTGPHTFPAAMINQYTSSAEVGFVLAPVSVPATLFFHTAIPTLASTYVENGLNLSWVWATALLPDNEQMTMNSMVQTASALILVTGQTVNFSVTDEASTVLCAVSLTGAAAAGGGGVFGASKWGAFTWGGVLGYLKQYRVPWSKQIVFKQATVTVTGQSQQNFAIGNLYLGIQPLNYLLEDWVVVEPTGIFTLDKSNLDGTDLLQ